MKRKLLLLPTALVLTLAACADDEAPSDAGILARAAGHVLTVEDAAELIAQSPNLTADTQAVRTVANLWIDYTLLANAAEGDSTFSRLDVSRLIRDLADEQLILALRDSVIELAPVSNEEVLRRFREEAPRTPLLRVRHILLSWPPNPTDAQADSVMRLSEDLRARIVDGGEDFAELARAHSGDEATAAQGGEIPLFGRGEMLPPIEEAAYALEPGEISPPVQSPYGVHLLKLEERLLPSVERFRFNLLEREAAVAESIYVARVEAEARPQLIGDALARVQALARDYRTPLDDREAGRPLVRYGGGVIDQGEVLWYLQSQPPSLRNQLAEAQDANVADMVLKSVLHRELLVETALDRGWTVPQSRLNEVATVARANIAGAARQLGLNPILPEQDEYADEAVDRHVRELLTGILTGTRREVTPLGPVAYLLRAAYPSRLVEAGLAPAVDRIRALRDAPSGTESAPQP